MKIFQQTFFRRPTFLRTPSRAFSYYSQPVLKLQQVDLERNHTHLTIPYDARSLHLTLDLNEPLSTLRDQLAKEHSVTDSVSFFTLDGAKIPDCELLKHRNNIPFIMTVNSATTQHNYAVNLNEGFAIATNHKSKKTSEEAYLEYCQGIGLPKYSSFLLANLASKIHQSIPKGNKNIQSETILRGVQQTMSYFRSVGNHDTLLRVSDLERLIEERQSELINLNQQKAALYRKADFRARALLTLGSTIFISQFAFIMSGTFVYYSWDVMEPISYMMMLGNFTVGLFFYAAYKNEMQLTTLRSLMAGKFARGIYRRRGFDIDKLERLEAEIVELREMLNKSIY